MSSPRAGQGDIGDNYEEFVDEDAPSAMESQLHGGGGVVVQHQGTAKSRDGATPAGLFGWRSSQPAKTNKGGSRPVPLHCLTFAPACRRLPPRSTRPCLGSCKASTWGSLRLTRMVSVAGGC